MRSRSFAKKMGYGSPAGYVEQAFLADVQPSMNACDSTQYYYWTSSVVDGCHTTVFNPNNGYTLTDSTESNSVNWVLCVKGNQQ